MYISKCEKLTVINYEWLNIPLQQTFKNWFYQQTNPLQWFFVSRNSSYHMINSDETTHSGVQNRPYCVLAIWCTMSLQIISGFPVSAWLMCLPTFLETITLNSLQNHTNRFRYTEFTYMIRSKICITFVSQYITQNTVYNTAVYRYNLTMK